MSKLIIPGGMSRRNFIKSSASVSAGLALVGTFPFRPALAQSQRHDIRIGMFGSDFGNLSPVVRSDISAGIIMNHVFDGLVRVDYAKRTIIPWLAEEWSNPDPLTWRIKLKEGVKWHGGYGEFTADDVAYTWMYHLQTKSFQVGTALFPLDSVKSDGKYVVEAKLKAPFGAFPGTTMGYAGQIISQAAHKEMGDQAYSAKPIGNGPYLIGSSTGNEVDLVKNSDYWRQGFPKLEKLSYRAIPDSTIRLQALQNGELDFITHPDSKDVAPLRQNTNYTTTSTPGWNWDYQGFNIVGAGADAPYINKLVRQAISYAIDREAIVEQIYNGEATPTDNQIPNGYLGYRSPSLLKYPKNGDLAKAQELMAQAGVSGYEVEVITSDKDWLRRELELVAAMVSQIGINYKIRNLDIGGFNNLWLNRKYQQSLEDITLVSPDPDSTSWWFLNSKGSSSSFSDPKMDDLLNTARATTGDDKRTTFYNQIVDMTLDESPLIYHCNVNFVRIFNSKLQGFEPAPQEYVEMLDNVSWA